MIQSRGRRYVRCVYDRYQRTGTPQHRLIRAHPINLALGEDSAKSHAPYRTLVTGTISEQDLHAIRLPLQRQHALGPDASRASIEAQLGRRATPATTARHARIVRLREQHSDTLITPFRLVVRQHRCYHWLTHAIHS